MKFAFTLGLSLLSYLALSQSATLPEDYFDRFSYQLPPNFDATDSGTLAQQVRSLADSVLHFNQQTSSQYQITDTTDLVDFYSAQALASLVSNQYDDALTALREKGKLQSDPAYVLPTDLFRLAYAEAHTDTSGQKSFTDALKAAVNQRLLMIDSAYRNDIVNRAKGSFGDSSEVVFQKELFRTLEQSAQTTQAELSYDAAWDMLYYYFNYQLRRAYAPTIREALFTLDPAVVTETPVMIPTRDTIRLSGLVYRDTVNQTPLPAIVSLSPYPSGREALYGNVYATNGYVYVYVDNRGRDKSEGEFFPYEKDAQDFYDIIDWVSKQPWCDGQVVTSGGSYLGFAQWQAIRQPYKHPALKAINPLVAVGFGIDFPRSGNMFYSYILRWATYVSGRELNVAQFYNTDFWNQAYYAMYQQRLPFAKLDSVAGLPNEFFRRWVSHPDLDDYWRGILPSPADYAALDVPVLTVTGYYDADQLGAMYYYDQHHRYGSPSATDQHYLLIGPYDHGGAQWQPQSTQAGLTIEEEAQVPIYKYIIRWFDWVVKGKDQPTFVQDKVNYFVTGAGEWRSAPSFEAIPSDTLHFYLSSQTVSNPQRNDIHALRTATSDAPDSLVYRHDITSTLDSAYLFNQGYTYGNPQPFSDSTYLNVAHNLVFESPELTEDLVLAGKIIPQLYLSLNVPDADFTVNLYEVHPDGSTYDIASSNVRARYRKGGDAPVLMTPGKVDLLTFTDNFIYIKQIKKGNRLRMTLESINSPFYEKNYGFGGVVSQESTDQPRIIEATLYTGAQYPSSVLIPYTQQ